MHRYPGVDSDATHTTEVGGLARPASIRAAAESILRDLQGLHDQVMAGTLDRTALDGVVDQMADLADSVRATRPP